MKVNSIYYGFVRFDPICNGIESCSICHSSASFHAICNIRIDYAIGYAIISLNSICNRIELNAIAGLRVDTSNCHDGSPFPLKGDTQNSYRNSRLLP